MGNKMMVDEVFHAIVRNLDLGRLTSPCLLDTSRCV